MEKKQSQEQQKTTLSDIIIGGKLAIIGKE